MSSERRGFFYPNFARISVRLTTSQQATEQVAACASVPSLSRSAVHPDLRQAWQAVGGFQSYASCPARLLVLTSTVIRAKFGYLVPRSRWSVIADVDQVLAGPLSAIAVME